MNRLRRCEELWPFPGNLPNEIAPQRRAPEPAERTTPTLSPSQLAERAAASVARPLQALVRQNAPRDALKRGSEGRSLDQAPVSLGCRGADSRLLGGSIESRALPPLPLCWSAGRRAAHMSSHTALERRCPG